jgi:hypothetical protein
LLPIIIEILLFGLPKKGVVLKVSTKRKRGDDSDLLILRLGKAHTKINSPSHAMPIYRTHWWGGYRQAKAFLTVYPLVLKYCRFQNQDKAKTLSEYVLEQGDFMASLPLCWHKVDRCPPAAQLQIY